MRSSGLLRSLYGIKYRSMATSHEVTLNYQEPPPAGKGTGRYIDQPDKGDLVDENVPQKVQMHNARELNPPAQLEDVGFTLRVHPTAVKACHFLSLIRILGSKCERCFFLQNVYHIIDIIIFDAIKEKFPLSSQDFRNDDEVKEKYYAEIIQLVKEASGCDRVMVFDHTVRSTASTSLNALEKGATAAAVPRVHCDYTADGAPGG